MGIARALLCALVLVSVCSAAEMEVDAHGDTYEGEDEDDSRRGDDEDGEEEEDAGSGGGAVAITTAPAAAAGEYGTFGEEWLATENAARVPYYKKKALALTQQASGQGPLANAKGDDGAEVDPFLLAWEAMNAMVAVLELAPMDPSSWTFAAKLTLKLTAVEGVGVEAVDAEGFFARAVQLKPELRPAVLKFLERSNDRGAEQVASAAARWREGVAPTLPPRSQAAVLMKGERGNAKAALRRLVLGKVVAGDGVKEGGGARLGDAEHAPLRAGGERDNARYYLDAKAAQQLPAGATGATALNGDGDRSAPGATHFSAQMESFDLWPTRLMRVNLAKAANLTSDFNEKLSRLALDKFIAYKATVEARAKREGRPMPSPNDLDDAFFSFQNASPQAVRAREGTERWKELYHDAPEYLKLASLIEDACREYIRRFARPGTLEQVGTDFSSDMWAAVYIPGTVHSHHTHQMSIVSAVYYSKTGPRNTPIVFSDPRGAAPIQNYEQYMKEHDYEPSGPFHQQFSYFPEEGELILFPSWLVHKVPSHHAKEERVAWPYNYKGTTWDGWARTAL